MFAISIHSHIYSNFNPPIVFLSGVALEFDALDALTSPRQSLTEVNMEHLVPMHRIKVHMRLVDQLFHPLDLQSPLRRRRPPQMRLDTVVPEHALKSQLVPLRRRQYIRRPVHLID